MMKQRKKKNKEITTHDDLKENITKEKKKGIEKYR